MVESGGPVVGDTVLAGTSGIRAPAEVFNSIFVVFLGLGTLVGVVVISYTLYNAYKYRYREGEDPAPDVDRPELEELEEAARARNSSSRSVSARSSSSRWSSGRTRRCCTSRGSRPRSSRPAAR
ncbi:hypothetical protein ACFQL4_01000 [Halosimplex aquaticum]